MPQNTAYQQSIAAEFNAIKDRVRYFIGDRHWGEDGRYKEVILMNFLRKILPHDVAVGTGFVKNSANQLTSQIDVIIYQRSFPLLFNEGDFVIVMPESVIGIIEVKSKTTLETLTRRSNSRRSPYSPIKKCHRNGEIIGVNGVFNGLFSYQTSISISTNIINSVFAQQLKSHPCHLNHICFDENIFCRFWENGNPRDRERDNDPCFSFYDLSSNNVMGNNGGGLAFGYFFSNLLETVYRFTNPNVLNEQYFEFLYPIEGSKENHRIPNCDIKIN